MPTYEYACSACGHQWEQVQRITEPPIEVCPTCAKSTAHRLISAGTNFILKGGGWYSDLYSSTKPSSNGSSGTSKAEATGSSPAGTASKPTSEPTKAAPSATPATASSGG